VKRARVHIGAERKARIFDAVEREVLGTREHVILHAADERERQNAHVIRVFGVRFLRSTPGGVAEQIDRRCQQNIAALRGDFAADR
jgi:hypothetical protein